MLLFAHVGLTLGAAGLLKKAVANWPSSESSGDPATRIALDSKPSESPHYSSEEPARAKRSIDWRLVILGSMLPDIIDKPLGTVILADTFSNGRIFAHTLLFSLILLLIGLYLYKRGRTGMLVVALCSMGHLILDSMWRHTSTLFWPLQGWEFPKYDLSDGVASIWIEALQTNPATFIPEIIGTIITASLLVYLLKHRDMLNFIKTGRISGAH
jgi:inner membrane protein